MNIEKNLLVALMLVFTVASSIAILIIFKHKTARKRKVVLFLRVARTLTSTILYIMGELWGLNEIVAIIWFLVMAYSWIDLVINFDISAILKQYTLHIILKNNKKK